MKVEAFEIFFDDAEVNPQAVYRSGQTINLKVHMRLNAPVKCRAVYVKLSGESNVHWSETKSTGSGKNRHTHTKHYRSNEVYLDQTVPIYTPSSTGPDAEHHPAGDWLYPVSFQLPPTAPSSFEGGVGKIRYSIKANIDRPWKFDNYTQKCYTVIRDLDLNIRSATEVGPFSTKEDYDVNCCYCCSGCCGKVHASVRLDKRGFVPGESVIVMGEIKNTSKTALEKVSLELYQYNRFHAGGKTKEETRVASSIELDGIEEGHTLLLNHQLPVRPVPSSFIEGCNNIEIHYYFRLNADGGCCLSMKKECCEIIIGTVPMWSTWSAYSQPSGPVVMQPMLPPAAGAAPPSYEECMFGHVDLEDEGGKRFGSQSHWAPSYPVYSLPAPAGAAPAPAYSPSAPPAVGFN